MEKDNAVISLKRVSCKIGHRYLIREIDWSVKTGEHWVVFGMNGSGKTTLLSIIAGFMHSTSGKIELFNEHQDENTIMRNRKKIGWVSASYFERYYTKESVLDIILSGKSGTLAREDNIHLSDIKLAKDILDELGMKDKYNRGFDTLSKGERQNVLIARALINNPEILILDEPCTGLDIYNRDHLFRTIEDLSRNKKLTIIYVTHYVEEILPLFDHIILLKNGRIFKKGDTKDILTTNVISDFLDCPSTVRFDEKQMYHIEVKTQSNIVSLLQDNGYMAE